MLSPTIYPGFQGLVSGPLVRCAGGLHVSTCQVDNSSQLSFSPNVAGAILNATGVTNVSASFTILPLSMFGNGSEANFLGVNTMIGLDVLYCSSGGVAAGIEAIIDNGEASYGVFITAFPNISIAVPVDNLTTGNNIAISLTATSATSVTVVITNESTNQTVMETVVTGTLNMQEADWIIEDIAADGSLLPLADFGTINFTNVSAASSSGPLDTTGATILNMEQNNTVLTTVMVSSDTINLTFV
ncbi:uncharacterized protein PHACADRAFT_109206 [Phanerochaete carnosa HHB-10118-sp]|uniref:Uncharacterized protein n=1 Tax=Phanerochaete carnosa (strain HHB-10118-sp) TaxID=650164 RepID=K5VNK1_PHACS|nr:uncharacterized protein PHACADRAFT_109206 [Phanerochaete carnosa HHB-10118-sp]EKM48270.1 hypothetical protein PHACADRAFT_109206 [Phanerochaete carnosa HHB-10118-sp]